jgi:hypothetical protein
LEELGGRSGAPTEVPHLKHLKHRSDKLSKEGHRMDGTDITCGVFMLLIVILIAIVVACFGLYSRSVSRINRQLRDAYDSYRNSLDLLKQNPNDPECREKALLLGRYYSSLTRGSKSVTVYDEVALANDIGAACAGAGQISSSAIDTPTIANQSIEQRLGRLKALLDSGAIDELEYRERRSKLLDEV